MNIENVEPMDAAGYPVQPFIPEHDLIKDTLMCFLAGENLLERGKYGFSTETIGMYRVPTSGFNFGRSLGDLVRCITSQLDVETNADEVDGLSVITLDCSILFYTIREISICGQRCRAVCVEPTFEIPDGEKRFGPGFSTLNLFYLWLGKKGLRKSVYNYSDQSWLS